MFVPGIAFFFFQQLDVKKSRPQSLFHIHAKNKRWVGKMLEKDQESRIDYARLKSSRNPLLSAFSTKQLRS
jgi:hypothetical protein